MILCAKLNWVYLVSSFREECAPSLFFNHMVQIGLCFRVEIWWKMGQVYLPSGSCLRLAQWFRVEIGQWFRVEIGQWFRVKIWWWLAQFICPVVYAWDWLWGSCLSLAKSFMLEIGYILFTLLIWGMCLALFKIKSSNAFFSNCLLYVD